MRLLHLRRARTNVPSNATFNSFFALRPGLYSAQLNSLAKDSLDVRIEDWLRVCRLAEQYCTPIEKGTATNAFGNHTTALPQTRDYAHSAQRDSVFAIPHATSVFVDRPRSNGSGGVLRVQARLPAKASTAADIDAKRDLLAAVKRAARHLGLKEHAIVWH